LLEENTEILTKYEKIANIKFDDTDVKSEGYFTLNRGLRNASIHPAITTATRNVNQECLEILDLDPVFENTINKQF
jgi:hypothetical protein